MSTPSPIARAKHKMREIITGSEEEGIRDHVKKRAAKAKHKMREIITGSEEERIRDHMKKRAAKIDNAIQTKRRIPANSRAIDKLLFTSGVAGVSVCQYIIFLHPGTKIVCSIYS
jgi:hypothetical protein